MITSTLGIDSVPFASAPMACAPPTRKTLLIPVMWAAALFYILYVLGMSLVVIQPCVDSGSLFKTIYTGFIFGLVAYGTYNLTNMAVLKGWSPTVTFVDMFWGGSLTAISTTTGLYIAKKIVHY